MGGWVSAGGEQVAKYHRGAKGRKGAMFPCIVYLTFYFFYYPYFFIILLLTSFSYLFIYCTLLLNKHSKNNRLIWGAIKGAIVKRAQSLRPFGGFSENQKGGSPS